MKKYEIMYILRADLTEEARNNKIEKLHSILTSNNAEVTKVQEVGLKDFAYLMDDQTKGYYVVIKVNAEAAALNEFTRLVNIDKAVIRHLITVDVVK